MIVQSVVKGGPADKAGIEGGNTSATIDGAEVSLGGDIITEVDGKKVAGMDEIVEIVNDAEPGDSARADDPARRVDQEGDGDARRSARFGRRGIAGRIEGGGATPPPHSLARRSRAARSFVLAGSS